MELQFLLSRLVVEKIDHVFQRGAEFEIGGFEVHHFSFQLGEIQNVVDDRHQGFPGTPDGGGVLRLFAGKRCVQQEPRHPDDAVERGSDFVTHSGQKDGACFHSSLGVELGFFQLDSSLFELKLIGDRTLQPMVLLETLAAKKDDEEKHHQRHRIVGPQERRQRGREHGKKEKQALGHQIGHQGGRRTHTNSRVDQEGEESRPVVTVDGDGESA